ncbi:TPA: DUF4400 domain-containing protein [Klebsiella aerogenes]|uniref:DUF4400 domain-containing protein n=1 Tax=Klebsiella aerogenes TaxID=548 RepID=UPI00091EC848|nr:DUF4400 domain-containing protein [Klebsiella aerogenes]SFX79382.1 integrating conjugative element membrane protein, PFL_4697 family [[Enterobacter] aerogenes] [Klebsiella aerogenes]HBS5891137.1 DUF4400 domain-containing protein [Klebsiella aerogenes]HBS5893132.1 DUF4400 domain-containing protein [Klebsiella aerogenes]
MSEQRPPPSRPPQGPVGWLLSLAGRLIGLVIGALVLRVVLELAGLYFWWPQEGTVHAYRMIMRELGELAQELHIHSPERNTYTLLDYTSIKFLHIERWMYNLSRQDKLVFSQNEVAQMITDVLVYVLISFMIRIFRLILNIPLILLFIVLGLIEGFVLRDLRRFGAGYESGFMFYWAVKIAEESLLKIIFCYLVLNIAINLFITLAIFASFIVLVKSARFKKFI